MLFNPKPGGTMDRINQWMTPERGIALQGLGMGLSQLAAGQAPNLSPAYQALAQRQQSTQMKQAMEGSGVLERFTPQQRALLAQMEPSAAQRVIASVLFKEPAQPKTTDDMTEYNMAVQQGFQGTLRDWILAQRQAGATVVNNNLGSNGVDHGDAPRDMAWARDAQGNVQIDERGAPVAVVIRGSETDRKQNEAFVERIDGTLTNVAAEQAADDAVSRSGTVVLEDIGRVREKMLSAPWYSPTAGFFGNILKEVAGTSAADVQQLTMGIRANIGFDRLQAMRDASPTGGALGNVTVQELERLESVLGSLAQSQSEHQLLQNLDRLEDIYVEIMSKAAAYPNAAEFGFAPVQANSEILSDEDLLKAYGLE